MSPLTRDTLEPFLNPVFVETGAGVCIGSRLALGLGFPKIITIEFDPVIYEKAVKRFSGFPQVKVVCGDSGLMLKDVIEPIQVPITFWLDSHGKSHDTTEHLTKKPLLLELAAIAAHPLRLEHTVLIDDWDVVTHPRRCPHLTEETVREALNEINPDFRLSRVDGLINSKKGPLWLVLIAEPKRKGRIG